MTVRRVVMGSAVLLFGLSVSSGSAYAQEGSSADLAKAVQNPLATMVTLPFQANWNGGVGEYDRTALNLNIQPVVPFPGENWNIISRTIIPVNSVPVGQSASEFGLGDTSFSLFFSPNTSGNLIWGIGPALTLPTASNGEVLGSQKWSIGPTGIVFYGVGKWTMGFVASQTWSFAGESDRDDVNFFFAQWVQNYTLGDGWAIGTAPVVTANWEAESGQQWTIPWGLQVSKVMKFGNQPVNMLFGYYENSEHPDNGAESQVRFQINLLYPN